MSGLSPGGTRSVASVFCAHPSAAMTKHGPRQKRRPRGTVALHRVFPLEGRAPSRPSWWAHLSSPWRDVLRHVRLLRASFGGHDKTWPPSEEAATRDRGPPSGFSPGGTRSVTSVFTGPSVFPLEGRAPSRPSSRAHRSFPWRDALRRVRLGSRGTVALHRAAIASGQGEFSQAGHGLTSSASRTMKEAGKGVSSLC
jgi:hypothetical protein